MPNVLSYVLKFLKKRLLDVIPQTSGLIYCLGCTACPFTVPKEGGKFRLVMNHSAGDFSLNSMIDKEDIVGITLDIVQDLGGAIREYQREHPNDILHIWKADVCQGHRHYT